MSNSPFGTHAAASGTQARPSADAQVVNLSETVLQQTLSAIQTVVLGKEPQIKLAVCCLLAKGHLLIEDLPGMGKTTLSHALAKVLGLSQQRVQFTSDLLPSDVLGASIYDQQTSEFKFVAGPVFTHLLLADEINRTTPKTQSALLEAMEERQVTVDGNTMPLPDPFFVIATQNPLSQSGTYPLPESQLDRFLMRIELGYPDSSAERTMLKGGDGRSQLKNLEQSISLEALFSLQAQVAEIRASDAILDYLQRLVEYSRTAADFAYGLSPRATLALLQAAKSWALIEQRRHVIPEDIQAVLPSVAAHRLAANGNVNSSGKALVQQMLDTVSVV